MFLLLSFTGSSWNNAADTHHRWPKTSGETNRSNQTNDCEKNSGRGASTTKTINQEGRYDR